MQREQTSSAAFILITPGILDVGTGKVQGRRDCTKLPGCLFDLLLFQPASVYPSLGNLVVPCCREVTILMPNLVWTPGQ